MALVVCDATDGITAQDLRIAELAMGAKCATAIVLNKWDTQKGTAEDPGGEIDLEHERARVAQKLRLRPKVLTASAQTGRGIPRVMTEALALGERMHQRVRKELWGYAPDEHLDNVGLIKEQYAGIRPAPGYPACPDHTEKLTLWELLEVEKHTGIELTESMAMWPGAAVSGIYYNHPQSQYFVVGRLGRDQVEDYAERKGWTLREAEKWLSPNLGYEPED